MAKKKTADERFLTIEEVAERIRLHPRTVYYRIRKGEVPFMHAVRTLEPYREVRIYEPAFMDWMAKGETVRQPRKYPPRPSLSGPRKPKVETVAVSEIKGEGQ